MLSIVCYIYIKAKNKDKEVQNEFKTRNRQNERCINKKMPQNVVEVMRKSAEKLAKQEINRKALKVGAMMPSFALKNAVGETIYSDDLLSQGPLIINFYRGSWCPYCNLELNAYQEILSKIHALGAQLVAISPELPDGSLSLIEKHSLKFEVLSDIDNKVARKFGLVFTVEEDLRAIYKGFGIDLVASQGNESYELPVPATYVVDIDGKGVKGTGLLTAPPKL